MPALGNPRQQEQQADELDALHDRLWALYQRNAAVYGAALKANIEATAAALLDLHAPVVVTVDLDTSVPTPARAGQIPWPNGCCRPAFA